MVTLRDLALLSQLPVAAQARDIFIDSSDAAGVSWTRASTRFVLHGREAWQYGPVCKAVVKGLRVGAAAAECPAVFVAIAPFTVLSWAWRWCGRLLGSQGSGGRFRLCTSFGASGDAAGAVQEALAALIGGGITPARRVRAEPNSHGGVLGPGERRSLATRRTPASWPTRGHSE